MIADNSNPLRCKNCSARLTGEKYCPDCGQPADTHVLTFPELISDVAGDLFNLDSRLWHTLVPLLIRPGYLTLEYLKGRRAHYLPPFRMYLVLSVFFFLLLSVSDRDDETDRYRRGSDAVPGEPADELDPERCQLNMLERDSRLSLMSRYICVQALENGDKFGTTFVDSIPVMMLIGFPLVAAMMLLLYPFSGRLYTEHIVFLFHVHAFFFLVSILLEGFSLLLSYAGFLAGLLGWIQIGLLLSVPAYFFLAMKKVYGQGILMTLTKLLLLGLGYLLCVSLIMMIGLFYVAYTI